VFRDCRGRKGPRRDHRERTRAGWQLEGIVRIGHKGNEIVWVAISPSRYQYRPPHIPRTKFSKGPIFRRRRENALCSREGDFLTTLKEDTLEAENSALRGLLEQAGLDASRLLAQAGISATEKEAAERLSSVCCWRSCITA
jgi:hypothetical protein